MNSPLIVPEGALLPEQVAAQVQLIQHLMREVMKDGEHYGVVPGCGTKPALLKPGAEKLCFTFQLVPNFEVKRHDYERNHREYEVRCRLTNRQGVLIAEGLGTCSTMESKYRYRTADRLCPSCGKPALMKSKRDPEFYCWTKKDGCGATFALDDARVAKQEVGKVENPDPADQWNTVLKMATKRAHVAATITACAASDLFTQDIEEGAEFSQGNAEAPRSPEAHAAPATTVAKPTTTTPAASATTEPTAADLRAAKQRQDEARQQFTAEGKNPDVAPIDDNAPVFKERAEKAYHDLKRIDEPLCKAMWKATTSSWRYRAEAIEAVQRGFRHALELWGEDKGYEHIEYVKQESGWPWGIEKADLPATTQQVARLADLCQAVATIQTAAHAGAQG